jgi:predicted SprT family Zn-dependent metalloprotease
MADEQQAPEPQGPGPAERISVELEASLLRELGRAWRDLNQAYFRGALRPPLMRLIDSRELLGRWDRSLRTIELSRGFVLEASWGSVLEVVKHEMAHQYVHEVLGAVEETAHGPAFRQLCERLGVDQAARGLPEAGTEDGGERRRVLRRVADLLALAKSPNRHEAENAAAVAQRLMLKHNIALSQEPGRRDYGFRHLGEPKGRIQESEHILAAILAEHFFVEAIWVPAYRPRDGKRGSVLEICGTHANLEMAGYAHTFLGGTAERLWQAHKRDHGVEGNRDRRGYLAGVMEGFNERLVTAKRTNAQQGLVWVGDADLRRYHRKRHPHVRSVRLRGQGHSDARAHGRAAGREIVLHRGIQAEGESRQRALPPARRGKG